MSSMLVLAVLLHSIHVHLTVEVPVFVAPPFDVRFDSVDYRNTLRWSHPSNSTVLLYSVQWKIYGESQWLDVMHCQGIQRTYCDLSSLTSDPREWYYGRVHATLMPSSHSAWTLSYRFSPRWETKLSPPALKLNVTEQGILVNVKPSRFLIQKMHKKLCFKIYVIDDAGEEEMIEISSSRTLFLSDLSPRTRYCLQAQVVILLQGKSSARSPHKCISTF